AGNVFLFEVTRGDAPADDHGSHPASHSDFCVDRAAGRKHEPPYHVGDKFHADEDSHVHGKTFHGTPFAHAGRGTSQFSRTLPLAPRATLNLVGERPQKREPEKYDPPRHKHSEQGRKALPKPAPHGPPPPVTAGTTSR